MLPETKYARSGDVSIAYQVIGDGPIDLVWVPGSFSHLEVMWEEPGFARYMERLASFSRVILFDKRGTGLSDRVEIGTLEQRMDDVRAVIDAVGSERAAVMGNSEGGAMSALFAATYAERTSALILYGAYANYPNPLTAEEWPRYIEDVRREWGSESSARKSISRFAPSQANDAQSIRWWGRLFRLGANPSSYVALRRMDNEIDIRHVLPVIHVPTLVIQRSGDLISPVEYGRYLAAHIPNAKYAELSGADHITWLGDSDAVLDEIEEFLTGVRHAPEPDRVLATVMFTDIIGSTERAAELGDRRWRDLLDQHNALVRRELARFRGREVETAGDSFLATFDGPARAIRCACAISDAVRQLGIEIRAGLHTGECELMGEKVGGIAVHTGARVAALAGPSEVLVSSTVKDLVAGSGIHFAERGAHTLRGVPGEWRLFAVERGS